MVYFKLLLNDKRPKSDNIYLIVLRITYGRNNTTLNSGIRINANSWDQRTLKIKHTYPNADKLNKNLIEFYGKIQGIALKLIEEDSFSFELLQSRIKNDSIKREVKISKSFNEFAAELVANMLLINKAGNAIIYQTASNRIMKYYDEPSRQELSIGTLLDSL